MRVGANHLKTPSVFGTRITVYGSRSDCVMRRNSV